MSTWYVRPSGGSYGTEDGTSYDNAWDGNAGITWGVGGVVAGDTLYICGTHVERLQIGDDGTATNRIVVRGDYPADPGIIDGEGEAITQGLWTNGADYIDIKNLTVRNISSGGAGSGIDIATSVGVRVQNITGTGCYFEAIEVVDSADTVIEDCTLTGNLVRAIVAYSATGQITNTIIRRNTITGNGRWGISLDSNNAATSTQFNATGFEIYENVISNNGGGFALEDHGSCTVRDNIIGDNLLTGVDPGAVESGIGINFAGCNDTYVVNNTINTSKATTRVMQVTVSATPCTRIRILGNTIEGGVSFIEALTAGSVVDGIVAGNRVLRTYGMYSVDNEWKVHNNTFAYGRYFSRFHIDIMNNLEIKNNVFYQESGQDTNYGGWQITGTLLLITGGTEVLSANNYKSTFGNIVAITGDTNYSVAGLISSAIDVLALGVDPELNSDGDVTADSLVSSGVNTNTPVSVDITGEPFPSFDVCRGALQPTDATNNPFHPLNL